MGTEAAVTIIVGVLGILGGGGFWNYRQSRKEAPVKIKDADLASAEKSQQMAMALAGELRVDLTRLRAELDAEKSSSSARTSALSLRVDELSRNVEEQHGTIRKLRDSLRVWTLAWDDLVRNWDVLRLHDSPPEQPPVYFE